VLAAAQAELSPLSEEPGKAEDLDRMACLHGLHYSTFLHAAQEAIFRLRYQPRVR